ncbi:Zinc finger and SCAN domain-containing protein 2 [Portunus trituberculatus]|uniref:Zinc finger and SCAN domain-containing protein 2 n=1 Tax=Portunus trituberculatus TaxID=210409 RepID=A0A5B7G2H9_PORTR|nr:Zinc finger and SCAN domain-containing protein 2 [Portunus trituberculatus]
MCLTCGSAGACVSVYSRVDNAEPLLSLLGHTLRRPVGDLALHSDVVCDRCHTHFRLMHRLMARLARLARQTTLGFNRTARWVARQQKQQQQQQEQEQEQEQEEEQDEKCLLVVEGSVVDGSAGGIVGRALAMAGSAGARQARPRGSSNAERKFECPVCSKKFVAYSHRVEHMLVHTGERAFHCSDCGFQASTKSNLARHRQRHSQESRCHLCDKTLANKFSLKEHLRIHGTERPHRCSQCGKAFLRRRELRVHERGHGVGEAPHHQCPECHKTFALRSRLARHALVHRQDKQFVCSICKKEFCRKDDLKCHERVHTGEKPYSCHHCGRTFRYASNCRSHMRVHQRRGLTCHLCNMTFPTQGKYATHLKSRNHRRRCEAEVEAEVDKGVPEMSCGVCSTTFESLDQLSAHTLASHITTPMLPDATAADASIIISGMDGERVVSFSQLEGVSVVVEVDRDATPLPMPLPHPSPPSTALLATDEEPPPPSPALLPFTQVGEGVGGTILASLTDGDEMVVCTGEEEEMGAGQHRTITTTTTTSTTTAYSNASTITTTIPPPLQQQTVTILNPTTVFKLADWDPNE